MGSSVLELSAEAASCFRAIRSCSRRISCRRKREISLVDHLELTSNVIVDDLRNLSMISADIRSLS